MSDPYSPYSPPGQDPRGAGQYPGYPMGYSGYMPTPTPQPQSSGASKAAASVMIVLALLGLLFGGIMILVGAMVNPQMLAEVEVQQEIYEMAGLYNTDVVTFMKWTSYVLGGLALAYAVVMGGLSPSIWKGRRWAAIVMLVLLGLLILLQAINVLGALGNVLAMCMGVVMILPHVVLIVLLVLMLRSGRQGNVWTYEQQMAMQAQAQQAAWQQYYSTQHHSPTDPPPPPPPPA